MPAVDRNPALSRRAFLRAAAGVAALPFAGELLAACTRAAPATPSHRAPPLPRPDRPVTWPVTEDLAIADGLAPERGATLKVFEWRRYLSADVLRSFERRYAGVRVEATSFESRDEAAARLSQPGVDFDVFFPTIDQIGDLVGARLLRPLNHSYLLNVTNLWAPFSASGAPFYDVNLGYTIPYTVFSTGIGWRADLLPRTADPETHAYDAFWRAGTRTKVGLYADYREALGMALLRDGVRDVNTVSATSIARAASALEALAGSVPLELTGEGYEDLPNGSLAIAQAWSGDMLSAKRFGHADRLGTTADLRYLWPNGGVVGCDLTAVCANGRNPVLAHAFLNHLLDENVALQNFSWNGYQPPVNAALPEAFADPTFRYRGIVPANLRGALLSPEDFTSGRMLLGLDPAGDATWQRAWRSVSAVAA
jgi:spermidine/putrescine transport system substrate-binding protein